MRARALLLVALALIASACGRERTVGAASAGGAIIIISVDTLRADYLPAYGATGVETPHIDALASDSIVFENAWSQVPLTLPSHASMFTGRLPAKINVRNNLGYRLDSGTPTIPSLLRSSGYRTGAAVSAWVLRGETGLGGSFDHYDDRMDATGGATVGEIQRAGNATVDAAIDWLTSSSAAKPFLFLHLFEPHTPYAPPEPFATKYAASPYHGEIAAADAAVGRLLDHLRANGEYERATIVFMSDHGEGLGDHGELEHGIFLYREAIRVPLFLKLPENQRRGERVTAPVALLDLFPTLLALGGVDVPESDGVSLLGPLDSSRQIVSETMYPRIHLGWSDLASLAGEDFHYIEAPRPELYDLRSDPGEQRNVIDEQRRTYAAMRRTLAGYDRRLAAPSAVSEEEASRLAALGYLGGASITSGGDLPDPKDRIADLEKFGRAGQLFRGGDAAAAIPLLREVVTANPNFADAWTLLAKAHEQAGRPREAIDAYRRSIDIAPSLAAGTGLSLARLYLRQGEFREALDHAALAERVHPGEAALVKAEALLGLRDPQRAEEVLRGLAGDPEHEAAAKVLLAQVRTGQRRFDEALALLSEVEGGGAAVANLWLAKGDVLARMGRFEEAVGALRRETAAFPGNREAWIRLAALHLLAGDTAEAERVVQAMIRTNPDESTRRMAARALRDLGRADLASKLAPDE